MNLIEQLGGYEEANTEYQKVKNLRDSKEVEIRDKRIAFDVGILRQDMLEYRRQHNIFEVGDLVIDTNHKDSNIQEVKSISGNKIEVFHKNKAYYYATYIFSFRHATDEEIKAGRRLPVIESDDCSDIRNHISPNTVVIDHAT